MADYCKQCSMELFGEDCKELAGIGQGLALPGPDYGYEALCEGCGPTVVNDEGVCIYPKCLKQHGAQDD